MLLNIQDDIITANHTSHTARRLPGDQPLWEASWLPGQPMNRTSAITAMVLADVTGPGDIRAGHRLWVHVEGWAAELGLTVPDVLARTSSPPDWDRHGKSATPTDPEAAG